MNNPISGKAVVLITGSTGFVGKHLVEQLVEDGYTVRVLLRPGSLGSKLDGFDVEKFYSDVDDTEAQKVAMKGVRAVFHCAGALTGTTYAQYQRGNAVYTASLVSAANALQDHERPKKFIMLSSQAAGGPSLAEKYRSEDEEAAPLSWYGASKYEAEQELNAAEFPFVILRPAPIYGPGDREFLPLFKMAKSPFTPVIGSGKNLANMLYIRDLIDMMLIAAFTETAESLYFAAGPGEFTQEEIALSAVKAAGGRARIIRIPLPLARAVGAFNSWLARISGKPRLLSSDKILEFSQPVWLCSRQRMLRDFPQTVYTELPEGMSLTAAWYKEKRWI